MLGIGYATSHIHCVGHNGPGIVASPICPASGAGGAVRVRAHRCAATGGNSMGAGLGILPEEPFKMPRTASSFSTKSGMDNRADIEAESARVARNT